MADNMKPKDRLAKVEAMGGKAVNAARLYGL
jgi:hypothetical protein